MSDLLLNFDLAQIIGLFASAFVIVGYFSKSDVKLKVLATIGMIIFSVHFYMIEAVTGSLMALITASRIGTSAIFHKSIKVFWLYILIYSISFVLIFDGNLIGVFAYAASVIGTITMYLMSGIQFRLVYLLGSSCWLIHDFLMGSIGGTLTEIFVISGMLLAIFRLYRDKKKNNE